MSDAATTPNEGWVDPRQALAEKMRDAAGVPEVPGLALRFAALSGRFDPAHALEAAGFPQKAATRSDPPSILRVATVAKLVDVCDTKVFQPLWIMRAPNRARLLKELADEVPNLIAWRARQPQFDEISRDICDVLSETGAFSPEAVLIALDDPGLSELRCERLVRALAFAQPDSPQLDPLRAALARIKAGTDPDVKLIEAGIFGRETEIATLQASIETQWSAGRTGTRLDLFYVGGIGGVGKSTLLAEVRRLQREAGTICLLLDFDRPGIEGGDMPGLSREFARQVAEIVGAPAGSLYEAIRTASMLADSRDEQVASILVAAVAEVLEKDGRKVLLSLDTIESLTRHGDTNARSLVEWLRMVKSRVPMLAIVAAGRETLPRELADYALQPMALTGLPDEAARLMLRKSGVSEAILDDLVALAKGNPLVLRLAIRFAADRSDAGKALRKITPEADANIKAGILYRLILSRIPDERLRAIAHPGLLLRQINAELLREVIAPEIGLGELDEKAADALLDELEKHAWLVERHGGWLLHRAELRPILLDIQIAENVQRAKRVFAAADAWHQKNGSGDLALYYRLQAMRWTKRKFAIDAEMARRLSDAMIAELPPAARELVADARGERSARFRKDEVSLEPGRKVSAAKAAAPKSVRDGIFGPAAASELRMLLERKAYAEAASMVSQVRSLTGIDPGSPDGGAVIEALWRAGDWKRAIPMLRGWMRVLESAWVSAPLLLACADMLPEAFRTELRDNPAFAEAAMGLATRHGEEPEWEVACMLLQAEGVPHPNGLVKALFGWAMQGTWPIGEGEGAGFSPDGPAMSGLPESVSKFIPDRLHAQLVLSRMHTLSSRRFDLFGHLSQATLSAAQRIGGFKEVFIGEVVASFAIDAIDSYGLLAEFLTSLVQLHPGLGFAPIAEAARRRRQTVCGLWSYGELPKGWLPMPTDWRTRLALHHFQQPGQNWSVLASEDIDRWNRGYGTDAAWSFAPMVKRSQQIADGLRLPLLGPDARAADTIAQRLIEAGVPLQLAPPLAILAAANSPLSPLPQPKT